MNDVQAICAIVLGFLLLGYTVRRAGDVAGLMWSLGFGILVSILLMGALGYGS